MVSADKAANNVVVVCRLHYVNTLKQELDGTRAYLETDTDEVSVVNAHLNDLPVKFSVCVNEGLIVRGHKRFVCLLIFMLNIPVKRYGNAGALPPFYWTFGQMFHV